MRVLNIGGGPTRELPIIYRGWEQVLLDIDPDVRPDIVCDAKNLRTLPARKYDAAYSSHMLEHFHKHEVPAVLAGMNHVLKRDGFVHLNVPDIGEVVRLMAEGNRDINDVWYMAGDHPITFHDVIYGWGIQVASGNAFYAHKTGFTRKSLTKALRGAGFVKVMTAPDKGGNIHAFAFKQEPGRDKLRRLGCL